MSAAKDSAREDPPGIEFVEAGWDVPQLYRADPLLLRFFEALKQRQLLAGKTGAEPARVIFPPTSFCEVSYSEVTELVPVGPNGTIRTFTVLPSTPAKVIVFVQLQGADTASAGYLRGLPEGETPGLELVGAPCRVVFADEPTGDWTDFWFELAI
jgi:uncharacterized OB-fold protein